MVVEEEKMSDHTEGCAEADQPEQPEQEEEVMRLLARAVAVKRPVLTQKARTLTCQTTCLVCQTRCLKTTTTMEMMEVVALEAVTPTPTRQTAGALETPTKGMAGALETIQIGAEDDPGVGTASEGIG